MSIGAQIAFLLNSPGVWGNYNPAEAVPLLGWFVALDDSPGISLQDAGKLVSLYWGGAMVGRMIGSVLLTRVPAWALLIGATAIVSAMCFYVFSIGGIAAGFIALSIGLFNSIMFPVIFTLTLERSSASAAATSGFLCTAIVGGAAIPPLVGLVSDATSYSTAFIVPMVCYGLLCLFAILAKGAPIHVIGEGAERPVAGH